MRYKYFFVLFEVRFRGTGILCRNSLWENRTKSEMVPIDRAYSKCILELPLKLSFRVRVMSDFVFVQSGCGGGGDYMKKKIQMMQ